MLSLSKGQKSRNIGLIQFNKLMVFINDFQFRVAKHSQITTGQILYILAEGNINPGDIFQSFEFTINKLESQLRIVFFDQSFQIFLFIVPFIPVFLGNLFLIFKEFAIRVFYLFRIFPFGFLFNFRSFSLFTNFAFPSVDFINIGTNRTFPFSFFFLFLFIFLFLFHKLIIFKRIMVLFSYKFFPVSFHNIVDTHILQILFLFFFFFFLFLVIISNMSILVFPVGVQGFLDILHNVFFIHIEIMREIFTPFLSSISKTLLGIHMGSITKESMEPSGNLSFPTG